MFVIPPLYATPVATFSSAVAVFATLDGTATNVTLSNGNLTATHSNTVTNSGARTTALKNAGKFYFEITVTDLDGQNDGAGVLTAAGTYTNLGAGTLCFAVYKSGNIYGNGAFSSKTVGAISDGEVLCFAIDLDNDLCWVRRAAGLWNGDGSGNPATGAIGVSISSFSATTMGPAVGFGGIGSQAGDNVTCNFGATAFVHTVPSGFTAGWPA